MHVLGNKVGSEVGRGAFWKEIVPKKEKVPTPHIFLNINDHLSMHEAKESSELEHYSNRIVVELKLFPILIWDHPSQSC